MAKEIAVPRRVAAYLDVENLLHDPTLDPGPELEAIVGSIRAEGDLVARVAVGAKDLMARLVPALAASGIRGFVHAGGRDAADAELIRRITDQLPARADTVVIGSGDHCFAPVARRLRDAGRRVVVLARQGCLSHELYVAADTVVLR